MQLSQLGLAGGPAIYQLLDKILEGHAARNAAVVTSCKFNNQVEMFDLSKPER